MFSAKHISVLILSMSLSLPLLAQGGGKQGPPPGQRRGPGYGQGGDRAGQNPQRRPGPHFGDWLRKSQNLSPEQKQKQLQSDPSFQKLPPERQQRLMERLNKFDNLPPEQQQRILKRMEIWEHMTPDQHKQARFIFDRMRELPDDRRSALRNQMKTLSPLSPEERLKIMNSDQFKRNFNDNERQLMQDWMQLRDTNTESATPSLSDDPPQH